MALPQRGKSTQLSQFPAMTVNCEVSERDESKGKGHLPVHMSALNSGEQ